MKNVNVSIISDIVCPWCVIGFYRLQKAAENLDVSLNIKWHPFELNPNMQEGGENLRKHLAMKYGTTLKGSIKARANITKLGADVGFTFNYFDEMKMYNTHKAHQLLHLARVYGKEHELKLRFFSDFFTDGKEMDDKVTLIKSALNVGIPESEALAVLQEGRFTDAVKEEIYSFSSKGISGVPAFIFNEKLFTSGAQEVHSFEKILLDSLK